LTCPSVQIHDSANSMSANPQPSGNVNELVALLDEGDYLPSSSGTTWWGHDVLNSWCKFGHQSLTTGPTATLQSGQMASTTWANYHPQPRIRTVIEAIHEQKCIKLCAVRRKGTLFTGYSFTMSHLKNGQRPRVFWLGCDQVMDLKHLKECFRSMCSVFMWSFQVRGGNVSDKTYD
jgi:hypothetical protein